ncbi:MAG: hypothetical protein K2J76_03105 [Oscillospiraceae bacterium]|nr:hypothetical protein [Oscillospiraceae bacterium]
MRLKKALSQIKPSEGQREKIYGDILDKLEKFSEEPPEEEKETRVVMKKRKILTSAIAALAAVVIVGGTVYAASPEVREMVRQVITINPIPQCPVEGFSMLSEIGTMLPKNSVQFEDFPFEFETVYAVNAEKTGENSYAVNNIAYGNGYVIVLCNEDSSGFYFEQGQQGTVNIVADLSSEFAFDEGELSEVGYIFDGKAASLFNGRIGEDGVAVDFTAETTGEYEFYIINYCAGLQNYKSITVENRKSTEEYYEIKHAWGDNAMETAGIEAVKDGVTVTENDFTEFAEGIRTKLVSVTNTGTFVELLLEFDFDEPDKAESYAIDYLHFTVPEDVREQTYSYGCGSLTVSDNGRIYGEVTMDFPRYIPEGKTITLELNSLSYCPLGVPIENKKIIEGYYSTDFVIGSPVKSYSANIEPTEISWTQPYMGDAVAKMELSGLSYSPKNVRVDLRMLEDCFVDYDIGYIQAKYFNCTSMFYEHTDGSEFIPIKFKMSDGTLKDVQYSGVHSDAIMEFDMSEFETDVNVPDENSPAVTTVRSDEKTETKTSAVPKSDNLVRITQDIPNDRPATITFEFWGIMDYTDVEAIVFCGKEIPITEKEF